MNNKNHAWWQLFVLFTILFLFVFSVFAQNAEDSQESTVEKEVKIRSDDTSGKKINEKTKQLPLPHDRDDSPDGFKVEGAAVDITINDTSGQPTLIFQDNGIQRWQIYNNLSDHLLLEGSGNVGIGTTTPAEKLDVLGKIKTSRFQMTNGANTGYLLESDGAGNAIWVSPSGISDGDWTIAGNNMYSTPTGNVGIGTTTPSFKLHLYGTSNNAADLYSQTDQGRVIKHWFVNSGRSWSIGQLGTTVAPNYQFRITDETGGTARLAINASSGEVGIGTTSPGYNLEVNGTFQADNVRSGTFDLPVSDGSTGQFLSHNGTWQTPEGSGLWGDHEDWIRPTEYDAFRVYDNTAEWIGLNFEQNLITQSATNFWHDAEWTGVNTRDCYEDGSAIQYGYYTTGGHYGVYADANGDISNLTNHYGVYATAADGTGNNYGIYGQATGNTGTKYGIYGTANGTGTNYGGYFYTSTSSTALMAALDTASSSTAFAVGYGSYQKFTVSSTGQISIAKSHGGGDHLTIRDGSTLRITDSQHLMADGSVSAPAYTFLSDSNTGIYRAASDQLAFTTGGSERLRIDASGEVGIGTATPEYTLDVYPSSGTSWVRARSSDTYAGFILDRGNTTSNGYIMYKTAGSGDWYMGMIGAGGSNSDFAISTSYSSPDGKFYIEKSTGEVGIGTTSPSNKLEVVGTAQFDGINMDGNIVMDGYSITGCNALYSNNVFLPDGNTYLYRGAGNALRVQTSSGYIDVGPQNSGWSHFTTNMPRFYFNKGITADSGAFGSYDEDLYLQTAGITRMTISNSYGNAAINTSPNSSYRLYVYGDPGSGAGYFYGGSGEYCYLADYVWEGVHGYSDSDDGVQGNSSNSSYAGVKGESGYRAIYGYCSDSSAGYDAVRGYGYGDNYGIFGESAGYPGGRFDTNTASYYGCEIYSYDHYDDAGLYVGGYAYGYDWIWYSSKYLKEEIKPLTIADYYSALQLVGDTELYYYRHRKADERTELGFIAEMAPSVFTNSGRNGISCKNVAAMNTASIKALQDKIEKLEMRIHAAEIGTRIFDFGSELMTGEEIWVRYKQNFSDQLGENSVPVVTITPHYSGVSLYVSEKNREGFRAVAISMSGSFTFDWIAMADVTGSNEIPPGEYDHIYTGEFQNMLDEADADHRPAPQLSEPAEPPYQEIHNGEDPPKWLTEPGWVPDTDSYNGRPMNEMENEMKANNRDAFEREIEKRKKRWERKHSITSITEKGSKGET
jgi:hypothetical protein